MAAVMRTLESWLYFQKGKTRDSLRTLREAFDKIHGTKRPVIGWIVFALGCVALTVALASSGYMRYFTSIAQRATGVVREMHKKIDKDDKSQTYAPIFEFKDADGVQRVVSSDFYSYPPEFHVGDGVEILYLKNDPQSARINTYWQIWGISTVGAILGCLYLPVGLIVVCWPKIVARFAKSPALTQPHA